MTPVPGEMSNQGPSLMPRRRHQSSGQALAGAGRYREGDDGRARNRRPTDAGTYDLEWFSLEGREWADAEPVTVETEAATVLAPSVESGSSVGHQKRAG